MRHLAILTVLVVALLATTSGQEFFNNFMRYVKEKFSGSSESREVKKKVLERRLNNMDFGDMDKATVDDIKRSLRNENLSRLNASLLLNLNDGECKLISLLPVGRIIETLPKEETTNLVSYGRNQLPHLTKQLGQVISSNKSRSEIVNELRSKLQSSISTEDDDTRNEPDVKMLLDRLGKNNEFTTEKLKEMKNILFLINNGWLMKLDGDVAKELCRQAELCIESSGESRSQSCPSSNEMIGRSITPRSKKMMNLRYWCLEKYDGPASEWKKFDLDKMKPLERIPMKLLMQVKDDVIADYSQELSTLLENNVNLQEKFGRKIARKVIEGKNLKALTTSDELQSEYNNLGTYFRQFVEQGDVRESALTNNMRRIINSNLQNQLKNGKIDGKSRKDVARKNRAKRGKLTATDCSDLGVLVSTLDSKSIKECMKKNVIDNNSVREIVKLICETDGVAAKGKLRALLKQTKNIRNSDGPDTNAITRCMAPMIKSKDVSGFSAGSIKSMFEKNTKLKPSVVQTMMERTSITNLVNLPANGRAQAGTNKVMTQTTTIKERVAADLPSTHPLSKLALEAKTGNRPELFAADFRNSETSQSVVPFMGRKEAMKVREEDVMEVLKMIKNTALTAEFCFGMRDKLANVSSKTCGTQGCEEALLLMPSLQIKDIPPCVISACGRSIIDDLDEESKQHIYDNLAATKKRFTSTGVNMKTMEKIIEEGLEAYGSEKLSMDDLEKLDELIILAPAEKLETLSADALPMFFEKINNLAMSARMPCLDEERMNAIGELIKKSMDNKSPSEWSDLSHFKCLLYMIDETTINNIDCAVLSSATCDEQMDVSTFETMSDAKKNFCTKEGREEMIKNKKEKLRRKQDLGYQNCMLNVPEDSQNRRKRNINSNVEICARAAVNGVEDIGVDELERMNTEEFNTCVEDLCSKPLEQDKAMTAVKKMKESLNGKLSNIKVEQLEQFNYCMTGFSDADIDQLPKFTYPEYNDVVSIMGDTKMKLSKSQGMAATKRVKETWKNGGIEQWTAADVSHVNNLLCNFENEEDINKINDNVFKESLAHIKNLECPLDPVTSNMMKKAETSFGDVKTWTASTVAELGNVFSAVNPETLMNMPSDAISGVTPGAIEKLPPSVAAVMTADQIKNLEGETAAAVTTEQMARFSDEQKSALAESSTEDDDDSSAGHLMVSTALVLFSSFFAIMY